MKNKSKSIARHLQSGGALLIGLSLLPKTSQAQMELASLIPVEMSMTTYLIIGAMLVFFILLFFVFQRRFNATSLALKDITSELETTRQRLVDTSQNLDQSQQELKTTSNRYQGILFDANIGMFQMDTDGTCSYINTALQEMSGLYPKKALKEGLTSAIHPDDLDAYTTAWKAFVESDEPFNHSFRFRLAKGREVHATCRANKVLNEKKEAESYIGWVSNETAFHEENLVQQAATARYENFVDETIEGHYRLAPESPIALSSSADKMAETLISKMMLSSCNDTFAAMYASNPAELAGKSIADLQGGCGPFRNKETLKTFIESGYKSVDLESVRQDPSGNRLILQNSVVGIFEDKKLVGIWGSQRNITQQKREKAELSSQVKFMHRILNALPADVHVKDTRCRYLYASKKLADRTGIPQEEWIGKTIFEVMPATPRDQDQTAITTMKTSQISRIERPYEARGKSGWMESIQIPLVSDEGLVEGVVALSLEVSARKKKEAEAVHLRSQLEQRLSNTQNDLVQSQSESNQTAASLATALQKLNLVETEQANREHEFKEHLAERKRSEETLRRSEQGLLARQQQLEKQLHERLEKLDSETDKRKKWEELLSIKEEELSRIEEHTAQITEYYEQETTRREQAETNLETTQASLEKQQKELNDLASNRVQEVERINASHSIQFKAEQSGRTKAEKQLAKTQEFLRSTQEQIKRMTEQHADELEKEVAERKTTAEKLVQNMDELNELRQQFNQRIESETKSIKQELAKKQIRERAMRQHEKDLEGRIKELETMLQNKGKDFAEQIQAREGAEVQKLQIEQKMEQMSKQQENLIDRETQRLHLNIAEIRLDEVKLRKRAGDLERAKEELEETLHTRNHELEKSGQEMQRIEATLSDAQAQLKLLNGEQSKLVSKETEALRQQLETLQETGEELRDQLSETQQNKDAVEKNLEVRNADLTNAAREYRKVVDAYKGSQSKLKQLSDNQNMLIAKKTDEIRAELQKLTASEKELQTKEQILQTRITKQHDELTQLADNLKAETTNREEAQSALQELQVAFEASQENADSFAKQQTQELTQKIEQFKQNETELQQKVTAVETLIRQRDSDLSNLKNEQEETASQLNDAELRLNTIKQEHLAELKKTTTEAREVNQMNSTVVDELNESIQHSLNPVVKTTLIMEQAENLSDEQKQELEKANHHCRTLIDTMNYRTELTHLADGRDKLNAEECDLHGLIADIDRQFCHRAETKNLFFAVSFAQYQAANNVPKLVDTDDNKLRKVLSILLGYAMEKTDKGRLGLHATREASSDEATNVAFELTYTSKESNDSLLSTVFDATKEAPVDLKYGLTLARQYISLLDGTYSLEFRDAGITALTIEFPFKRVGSEISLPEKDDEKQAGAA